MGGIVDIFRRCKLVPNRLERRCQCGLMDPYTELRTIAEEQRLKLMHNHEGHESPRIETSPHLANHVGQHCFLHRQRLTATLPFGRLSPSGPIQRHPIKVNHRSCQTTYIFV